VLSPRGDGSDQGTYDEVVQFGNGRSPGGRWLPRIALACLVLAAIVTLAVRGAGNDSRPAGKTPPPPAIRLIRVGHRLLGVTASWELFARGPDDLVRVQLAQGKISVTHVPPLGTADPNVAFVIGPHEVMIRSTDLVPGYVVPDGTEARPLPRSLADGGPMVPGPAHAQAGWVMTGLPGYQVLSLVSLTGRPLGPKIRFAPDGPQLPATAVSDGRGDVLVDTGTLNAYDAGPGWYRLVPGTVVAVGPTSWLVVTCDPVYRHCRNEVVDIADGARRILPGSDRGREVTLRTGGRGLEVAVRAGSAAPYPYDFFTWPPTGVIAPDGSTAAVAETPSGQPTTSEIPSEGGTAGVSPSGPYGVLTVHLLNLRTGANRDLKIPLGASLGDESMVWSPDSRWLFVAAADGKLVAVDASTGRAELLQAPLPAVEQVAIRP
jgi:hypothetical protein